MTFILQFYCRLLADDAPPISGIERTDLLGDAGGVISKICLVDNTTFVDDKRFDAGNAVSDWPGDQPKARNHIAVDDVIKLATGNILPLAREDPVAIAVVTEPRLGFCKRCGIDQPCAGRAVVAIPLLGWPV